MPGVWLSGYTTFEANPQLKVGRNICAPFQCSCIKGGCVPEAINRKLSAGCVLTFICIGILAASTKIFFSNFMIILLCESFISSHKSGFETVTYLIELLNNFNIPATSRIFIYSFAHVLCFPCIRR